MILVESSAWVEFLRATGSVVNHRVRELVKEGDAAVCDPVRLELLAGARDERQLSSLDRLLAHATVLPTEPVDYDTGAALYRTCRRGGETVRTLLDCVIAAVAIRADVPVLHRDRDFDVLARHTALRSAS